LAGAGQKCPEAVSDKRDRKVIVLSEHRDPRTARPIDTGNDTTPGQEPQQGRCRRRRSLKARVAERHAALEARRRTRGATIKAHHKAQAPKASRDTDPEVIHYLGRPIPITAAELSVVATYLGDVLEEILGPKSRGARE
jgi:hypothetical protein